jgi:hypothetical protein
MRTLLFACLALALGAGSVSAADRLSDTQLDQISAGALVPTGCGTTANCSSVSATSTSSVSTVVGTSGQFETLATVINQIICGSGCSPSSTPTNTSNTVGNGTSNPAVPGSAVGIVVSANGLSYP